MLPIVTIENDHVRLSPIKIDDIKAFNGLNRDPSLWSFFPYDLTKDHDFEAWLEKLIQLGKEGKWYAFVVFDKSIEKVAGLTGYLNIDEINLALEIGGTWYGSVFHGTNINPNCKLLMLQYAFENLGFERVELKTDVLNARSRRAIEKLGAKYEGIHRSERIVQNNRRRDTVYYSILKAEWAEIKSRLEERIKQYP